jgi:hypothetical protein
MTRLLAILRACGPLSLVLFPLALIFVGVAMLSLPAAMIAVGTLLWLDLYRKDPKQ